ncbi:hypothetical protein KC219_25280, partial [Mycobacterium tuberculosis]|nr:hypothetical protein [Mycobacterium tuberculosis]
PDEQPTLRVVDAPPAWPARTFDLLEMGENKLPFGEGASIHRPPMFSGINYQFWKIKMKIFIESFHECGGEGGKSGCNGAS